MAQSDSRAKPARPVDYLQAAIALGLSGEDVGFSVAVEVAELQLRVGDGGRGQVDVTDNPRAGINPLG
jgi:hypothetical protein